MSYQPPTPSFLGRKILNSIDWNLVIKYIDWTFFFKAWKVTGKYPGIEKLCECPSCKAGWLLQFPEKERTKAEEVLKLFQDARNVLKEYVLTNKIQIKAVLFFSEVKSVDEGILIIPEKEDSLYLPTLRQQRPGEISGFCVSLSDFISSEKDYIGAFAISVQGAEEIAKQFQKLGDDYNSLLIKSIADRLAEATSEWLHEQVRKMYWGYAPNEKFTIEELRKVPYQGIRPAMGYPSLPDQSILFEINKLLHIEDIGINLTENGAMFPTSSICGLYFSHPEAFYFMVGKIGKDQFIEYAKRRNIPPKELKKWLTGVFYE